MTTFSQVVGDVTVILNAMSIKYMLVGSVAASIHGYIRDTHDLDIVIVLKQNDIPPLIKALGDEYYIDEDAAYRAIDQHDMFNIIHYESGVKIDFWILKEEEFSDIQFERRQQAIAFGIPIYVESPEDTILSKLLWYRITPSDRQLADVKGILAVKKNELDYYYLHSWSQKLNVVEILNKLIEEN